MHGGLIAVGILAQRWSSAAAVGRPLERRFGPWWGRPLLLWLLKVLAINVAEEQDDVSSLEITVKGVHSNIRHRKALVPSFGWVLQFREVPVSVVTAGVAQVPKELNIRLS